MHAQVANQKVRPADVEAANAVDASDDTGRTLRRGLAVLDAVLGGGPEGLRLVDLCQATGLQRPTVYRVLEPLIQSGYVQRHNRFRYQPGPRFASHSQTKKLPNMAVRLQPVLAQVSAACGDASFAIVREGSKSHCIARQIGTYGVQMLLIQVGTLQPLGVGAAGLALLAALPDDEVDRILVDNAPVLGNYGGMTPDRMRILVRATRERGWSLVGNHATQGVLSVGKVVRNAAQEPVAAVSVPSTMERMMSKDRQRYIAGLIEKALHEHLPDGI